MSTILSSGQISELLTQYKDLVDQTYDIFAVNCDIYFSELKTVIDKDPDNNIPDLNSINNRRKVPLPNEYDLGNKTVISVEVKDTISLKIYWSAKEWRAIYGYTTVPDNHVMFLAKLDQANKLDSAIKVIFTDDEGGIHVFTRISRAIPYGLDKKKDYCSSIWAEA